MTGVENPDKEIIYLQLKKPKKWNWEISTSKSSPHIALPTIQLYNSKNELLVETHDHGSAQRKNWYSFQGEIRTHSRSDGKNSLYLQRSRSDNLEKFTKYRTNNLESNGITNRSYTKDQKATRRCVTQNVELQSLLKNGRNYSSQYELANTCKNSELRTGQTYGKSKKSSRPHQHQCGGNEPKTRKGFDYQKNDKLNEYHDLLSYKNTKMINQSDLIKDKKNGYKRNITEKTVNISVPSSSTAMETVMSNHRPFGIEVTRPAQPKKYRLTQSRAGILVISDESFSSSHRRRNHGDFGDYRKSKSDVTIDRRLMNSMNSLRFSKNDENTSRNVNLHKTFPPRDNNTFLLKRDTFPLEKPFLFEPKTMTYNKRPNKIYGSIDNNYLQSSNSNITNMINKTEIKSNINGTRGKHMRIEPNTEFAKANYRSMRPESNYEVSSSDTKESSQGSHIGNQKSSTSGVCELQHLVQQISPSKTKKDSISYRIYEKTKTPKSVERVRCSKVSNSEVAVISKEKDDNCHVSGVMGANVSRHSTKGLSGRRSQSSGSICNGKERYHGDGSGKGSGGSLPSCLDDKCSTSTNNYENEEKATLDEGERIPPLGDGAPLHWKFSDVQTAQCQDQGYGSERSPEEEYPPPLLEQDLDQCHHHLEPHSCYPFITPESTFLVKLCKGSRGLGLSVTGGIESGGSWPGLVRIKRLFPNQPASACGLLNVGDLLLEVNGVSLTGLTNYEALEVLRTATNQVELKVSRPPPDVLNCVSPISEVPPPPPARRDLPNSLDISSSYYGSTPEDEYYHGEFEVILTKIQGSLGFTLRKEDDSALGHYVRALVREPALTDGRIKAGDKIIAVNDVEIFPMSHEQAVQYLRKCGDKVKLRLYRDSTQTPVAALSPTETTPRTSFSKKANLRQEAVDMLNDIAIRKLNPRNQQQLSRRSQSPTSSPRRFIGQDYSNDASHVSDTKYLIPEEQFHEGMLKCKHFDEDAFNSLFTIGNEDMDRPLRPNSLDLYNPNQTPVAARKPRFNFSLAHNAYELNNLDPEVLDAPNLTFNIGNEENVPEPECDTSFPNEPSSMPHIPLDKSSNTFRYKNPTYQSAHPPCGVENNIRSSSSASKDNHSTHKDEETDTIKRKKGILKKDSKKRLDKVQVDTEVQNVIPMEEEFEILAIELSRGWNSRLGFSLQGAAGVTYVSAVYADSVAAKDGRIKPGDRIVKVNDEEVDHMSTNEIIDLLRIVRGPVCIFVKRIKSNEDCTKSNAEN